ncbi:MAG: DUF378 domain-containing protein [Alphaproteobacteria bacterium]|jgi:uncharacterized membrane protein YuzA (DUF378 family)|nr:DUF378 domain-containing protein [Alphaproteobacteria bacterium]MBP9777151.1 DUF378 domain-containing protein [Alphaproteobacteria bacterium]
MDAHYIIGLIAYILVIFGALNWGLVGALGIDLVARIFGSGSFASRVVYILIGIAAIIMLLL